MTRNEKFHDPNEIRDSELYSNNYDYGSNEYDYDYSKDILINFKTSICFQFANQKNNLLEICMHFSI